ncbi:MAG: twin-arginine translocation signal domain-containing protein [Armatimonadia bacterium]|nr:twin-arginine translocation signal domain-containing protein [Armatimonadia bacterium]
MKGRTQDDAVEVAGSPQTRRGFLKTLGVAGAGLTAGAAWGAPPVIRPTPHAGGRRPAARATGKLQVKAPVQVPTGRTPNASHKIEVLPPPPPSPVPTPSTRERALAALLDSPASKVTPEAIGIASGTAGHSAALSAMIDQDTLAAAYAEGITLKPGGCEYTQGAPYDGEDPIRYWTTCCAMTPEVWGEDLFMDIEPTHNKFMKVFLRTPGSESEWITYIFELAMAPLYSEVVSAELWTRPTNGMYSVLNHFSFTPTTDDTYLAVADITGAGTQSQSASMSLNFEADPVGHQEFRCFQWLNVIAI